MARARARARSRETLFIGFPFSIRSMRAICASAKSASLREPLGHGIYRATAVKTRIRIKAKIHERVPAIPIERKRGPPDCGIRLIVKFSRFLFVSFFSADSRRRTSYLLPFRIANVRSGRRTETRISPASASARYSLTLFVERRDVIIILRSRSRRSRQQQRRRRRVCLRSPSRSSRQTVHDAPTIPRSRLARANSRFLPDDPARRSIDRPNR